jgi:hypothetical protein
MSQKHIYSATIFLTWKKLRASRLSTAVFAGFPAALIALWIRDSYEISFKLFLLLFPRLFLCVSQNPARDEIDSGVLENGIFTGDRFRSYLGAKSAAAASIASIYALTLFSGFALFGFFTGAFEVHRFHQFLRGLAAGWYYSVLGGVLGFFLRGGFNLLIILGGQAGLFFSLIILGPGGWRILDCLETGSFPDWISLMSFGFAAGVVPNLVISRAAWSFALEIIIGAGILAVLLKWLAGRLELEGKREGRC